MSRKKRPQEIDNFFPSIQYFKPSEFDSPDSIGSGKLMDYLLVYRLEQLRKIVDQPLFIDSGFRTEKRNKDIGGAKDSSHMKGLAADVKCVNSLLRFKIVRYAMWLGISRIGVYSNHVHLDIDTDKPYPLLYYGKYKKKKT